MARTINSPGVEIFERDESETTVNQVGTAILVQGFAHQGPTNELIHISSKEELNQVYFGGNGPTNDAEQYFYHSCAEILNSPANLYTIRLPYGLDSGEGFSGKYVALAYGGTIDTVPVTKKVHRNVQEDDFIPGDINTHGNEPDHTQVDLYEFTENSVRADDPDTSAFYAAVEDFVSRNFEYDPETDNIFDEKYASAFPLENDQFWINKDGDAYAIDISPKTSKICKTYDVAGYDVEKLEFRVPVKRIMLINAETAWTPSTTGEGYDFNLVERFKPTEKDAPSAVEPPAGIRSPVESPRPTLPSSLDSGTETAEVLYENITDEKYNAVKDRVYNDGVVKKQGETPVKAALADGTFAKKPVAVPKPPKVANPDKSGVDPSDPTYPEKKQKYEEYVAAKKIYDEYANKLAVYEAYKEKLDANITYLLDLQLYYDDQVQKEKYDEYLKACDEYNKYLANLESFNNMVMTSGFDRDQVDAFYKKYAGNDYVQYDEKKWNALYKDSEGNAKIDSFDLKVTFQNVGQMTTAFVNNVLNAPISLYDQDNKRLIEDTDVHPFQGLNFLYARKKDEYGNVYVYRVEYGRALETWKEQIQAQLDNYRTNIPVRIAYGDDSLANVYVRDEKNQRHLAGLDEKKNKTLIVDTEKIANVVIDHLSAQIDKYNKDTEDVKEVRDADITDVEFADGVPMQDANTQLESYHGPFTVEPITPMTWTHRYTINHYDNILVTERIKEIDVEEPELDSEGNIIYKNVLTLNPVPVALPLSQYQYQAIQEGAVEFKRPVYNLDGEGTGYDAFRTVLGKSAFYIINKMQTSLDDKYQGFYVAMMDRSKFVEKVYGQLKDSYDPIKEITYVSSPDDAGNVTIEVLPERAYHFDIKGEESLSTDIMSKVYELDLSQKENFDNIVMATVRCGRRASSSDPSRLSYDLKDVTIGSFNVGSTIINPITKARVPNRLDTKMKDNDYMEVVINEKFELSKYVPKEVKFGGKEYPNRDQESGTCCSLGLEIPCMEENTAEYIGNVPAKIEKALSLCDNVYELDLDIVVDAGLTTIWAYVAEDSETDDKKYPGDCIFNARKYIENNSGTPYELLTRTGDAYTDSIYYRAFDTIRALYTNFCQKTRKDCMFLIDPIRAIFVRGRDTKLMNIDGKIFSIDVSRALRNTFSQANTSYGASYANWVKIYDQFNDEFIWMPSSPFEASIMATVDANYYPWYAPYGLNNGVLSSITDIAFRPSPKQQDDLYKMGLNMFVFFNGDGFVSWGQKTLQTKASAFDRINVRRLFLTLERSTFKTVRYFVGEPNTTFTRTRVTNALTPIFDVAANNEGLYDYRILCDERNNTPAVIDANELVIDIYIKPTRIIDFIEVTFHATRTDANFDELINS